MTRNDEGVTIAIAARTASRYKRRVWWASHEDMVQVGAVAILEARKTFDPTDGVPFSAYASRAAVLAVRSYLWKQSAPVSKSGNDSLEKLEGLHRAPLAAAAHLPIEEDHDERLHRERLRSRVRSALRGMGLAEPVVGDVLALASKMPEAIPVTVGRAEARRAWRRATTDLELWQLWRQM